MFRYCWALNDYRSNPPSVNHQIVVMLHLVAFRMDLAPLLYHASVRALPMLQAFHTLKVLHCSTFFRTLQSVGHNAPASPARDFQEIRDFGTHFLKRFFEDAMREPKVFVEMLFWMSAKNAVEIQQGYGTS